VLNHIWLALVVLAVAIGGWSDRLNEVTAGAFDGAKTAVTIALGLIGVMALWLGVMRLAERAGLVQRIARGLRPIMRRLFPDVPPEHPAMGSMLMNMAANMLGLGNAATPLGLRAMRDLETLNPRPGVASNAMCTFLAINTASVQLIPATAIALLAAAGSVRPTAIVGTGAACNIVRGDGRDHVSKGPGEAAVLSLAQTGRRACCSRGRRPRKESQRRSIVTSKIGINADRG
jgi:spore maturation protein A